MSSGVYTVLITAILIVSTLCSRARMSLCLHVDVDPISLSLQGDYGRIPESHYRISKLLLASKWRLPPHTIDA